MAKHSDHQIELIIDGEEVLLEENGESDKYLKYKAPDGSKVLVNIYIPKK